MVGPGVTGEQPTPKPREAFRYTSVCPLPTPSGEMRGAYQMVNDAGAAFEVEIPASRCTCPARGERLTSPRRGSG